MANERLQKILARAGVASRRAAEGLITAGRVRVNGRVITELGSQADLRNDRVEVDGRRLVAEDLVYIVLHKPRLVVSTLDDPEGRPTVKHLVRDISARIHPVGRLDFHTSGVLLMTNDGDFTQGLLHPRREVPKTYIVKVSRAMEERDMERWRTGVELEDGKTAPAKVKHVRDEAGKSWLEVTIHEGKNQQIRRMGEATGFPIMRLARLSFADIDAEGLRPGAWRYLTRDELVKLKDAYGVPRKVVMPGADAPAPPRHGPPRDHRGIRPDAPRPERREPRPVARGPRVEGAGRPERASRPEGRGARPETRGARPEGRGPGRPTEGRGRPPEGRGRPAESRGRPSEGRGRPAESRGRPSEGRGRPMDSRGRPPEGRGGRAEGREHGAEGRGRPPSEGRASRPQGHTPKPPPRARKAPVPDQKSSAATPSAKTHERGGTRTRPPSRTKRPR